SEKLQKAAKVLSEQPQALQLRYLQTMSDIASEGKTHTIVFPLPMDLITPLLDLMKKPPVSNG
ncbi:MAG: slipin family protein, partial [Candidatus Parabeggiatoa sp. nov. 3]